MEPTAATNRHDDQEVSVLRLWWEGAGLITMGLARHGVGNWDFALGVTELPG